jgi:hypothetical protein
MTSISKKESCITTIGTYNVKITHVEAGFKFNILVSKDIHYIIDELMSQISDESIYLSVDKQRYINISNKELYIKHNNDVCILTNDIWTEIPFGYLNLTGSVTFLLGNEYQDEFYTENKRSVIAIVNTGTLDVA